ncbi:conserved exported hypothetical protein [Flavobacterium sp. 9AF]|uniref:hypothetical protein n=1 Tax=Flavobacterium sp. 9AF TaxID=2653142 RepID=UPI0012F2D8A4|nr:hypothetical protein [Flavobacterium sp. 9AF]VXB84292.1 conserved exported hypothetical protein [Flavobacterium sp. 9AF]
MKKFKLVVAILVVSLFTKVNAQVRIGGSVDISINFPSPKVIIVKEEPRPVYKHKEPKKCKVYKPKKHHCEPYPEVLGVITNQNGRYDRVDLAILDVTIENIGNGLESVTYFTNTNETLEIIIRTNNPNDYNYHYSTNPHCAANVIVSVALNGYEMPLRDGSISLQPGRQLHSVVNLHSFYEGNFNGTVNF